MSDLILARVSQTLAKDHTLESLVRHLLEMLELVTEMESTWLTRIDNEAHLQHILYARNSRKMQIPEGLAVPWNETLCKRALDERCFFSNEVDEHWKDCHAARNLGIKTYLSTPIHLTDGSLYGTLCAASDTSHSLSERGEQILELFASLIAHHIERESLVEQLKEANAALVAHSYTDALTGLPNRRALFEKLSSLFSLARHLHCNVVLAFIDLNDFKLINDRYGHQTGDDFLIGVGKRLTARQEDDEITGQLGGDEFLVARLGSPQAASPQAFKAALHQQIQGVYHLDGITLFYPGASIGVIEADPFNRDADSALREADAAMYQEKRDRRHATFFHID